MLFYTSPTMLISLLFINPAEKIIMNPRVADIFGLVMGLLTMISLAFLIIQFPPSMSHQLLALILILLMVVGFTAPIWRRILRKFIPSAREEETASMGLRFGLWTGLFIATLLFLRVMHFMDRILILAILALLIMIEMFLQQHAAQKRAKQRSRRPSR